MRHNPGKPIATDVERLRQINLPFVYLDWNVFQYLRKDDAASALLEVASAGYETSRVLLPYSRAHVFDATAQWGSANRPERIRDMVFANGISDCCHWSIPDNRHALARESMASVAEKCGMTTSMQSHREAAPMLVQTAECEMQAKLMAELEQPHLLADNIEEPAHSASLAGLDAMEEIFMQGLPDASEIGKIWMQIFGPLFQLATEAYSSDGSHVSELTNAHPVDAVTLIESVLRKCNLKLDHLLTIGPLGGNQHPDDIGPMMLGFLGYFPEDKKKIRQAKPGFFADASHSRFALNSAVFVTGDERLAMHVDAWAHHTGRGIGNGKWPIVSVVRPGDRDGFERTADVIAAVGTKFPDNVMNLFDRDRDPKTDSGNG